MRVNLQLKADKNPQTNVSKENGNLQIFIKLQESTYHNIETLAKKMSSEFDTHITVEQIIIDELTTIFRKNPHNSKLSAM